MTVPTRRKLIEVALPLAKINAALKAEKDRKVGKPQSIHHWWARRPITAARAVLFAQLVDDPSSFPDRFPTEESIANERRRLHDILEQLVLWESGWDQQVLDKARAEILAATDGNPPEVLDPFAGGGAIPMEAQRLGLVAHASDLNPVAVLINEALITIPPRFSSTTPVYPGANASQFNSWSGSAGLVEDVRSYGEWMRLRAVERIGHLYPRIADTDGIERDAIAWIWARTVQCPNPACGIRMPLVQSWWLSKKPGRQAYYVMPTVNGTSISYTVGKNPTKGLETITGGTVHRSGAVCVRCHATANLPYLREQGMAGAIGSQLIAIVAAGNRQRIYLAPNSTHENSLQVPPPEQIPLGDLTVNSRHMGPPQYGFVRFSDLFTNRQLVAMNTFTDLITEARERVYADALNSGLGEGLDLEAGGNGALARSQAIATYLALAVSRLSDWSNAFCRWESVGQVSQQLFGQQSISMAWDYSEAAVLGQTNSGSFGACIKSTVSALSKLTGIVPGYAVQANAADREYSGYVLSTDPPYYDNVPYADLSDFFYCLAATVFVKCEPGTVRHGSCAQGG